LSLLAEAGWRAALRRAAAIHDRQRLNFSTPRTMGSALACGRACADCARR